MDKKEEEKSSIQRHIDLLPKHLKTYRISTIARCWGKNYKTVNYWIKSGLLKAIAFPDAKARKVNYSITKADLIEFLKINNEFEK